MKTIYNISIKLMKWGLSLASFIGHSKSKLGIEGRKNTFEYLSKNEVKKHHPIWFHISSLGEYEQALPLIEALKKQHPQKKILVSFFSPSGYEMKKNDPLLDFVVYLPFDEKKSVDKWYQFVNPSLIVFVKYDLWYQFLSKGNTLNIPKILISATFRKNQIFFKGYGSIFREMLGFFNHIFVQTASDLSLLKTINITEVTVAGDTRIDRVAQIRNQVQNFPKVVNFLNGQKACIFGSTWESDEKVIENFIKNTDNKCIIAPHDIQSSRIKSLQTRFPTAKLYSDNLEPSDRIVIINNIGILKSLYQYGKFAYIGGGFESSIHNILEPATFGIPVIFGTKHHKFKEASDLIKRKGGFSIEDAPSFERVVKKINQQPELGKNAGDFIKENEGATEKIMEWMKGN